MFDSLNDGELESKKAELTKRYSEALRDNGRSSAIMLFYGVFAFFGVIVWCVDEAVRFKPVLFQAIIWILLISGAISLFYGNRKDKDRLSHRLEIHKQLSEVSEILIRRNNSRNL